MNRAEGCLPAGAELSPRPPLFSRHSTVVAHFLTCLNAKCARCGSSLHYALRKLVHSTATDWFTKRGGIHGIRNPDAEPLKFVAFLYHTT